MSDITVIGGIAADIEGHPYDVLKPGESNPGKISISYGGVGRNITENLARMGASISFVSAAGNDFVGRMAVQELAALGVGVENVHLIEGENTAMYLSILNSIGDMEMALCNMDVLERISVEIINKALPLLKRSKIVGIDANLIEEVQTYIMDKLQEVPLFLDPVSAPKAERSKKYIGRFHTIKPNIGEAQVLSDIEIADEKDLSEAGKYFISKGVKRVFITLNARGVYYKDEAEEGIIRPGKTKIVSATGAGDAFSAAILDSFVKGRDIKETALYGMAASGVAMESKTAVNPNMSIKNIEEKKHWIYQLD
ncbi:carbohydrate kinase family protein [Aminipila luticellarii]|uniref:Kinase n=1 Tax=Aminipila luticellarii TaxID=2507160 RepID=A0A410PSU3_9FIRM|nr:carbohydrate kinase family protein [Aminipila luticellarii]QAT42051.1 kinase [Aminipila luticellarii]